MLTWHPEVPITVPHFTLCFESACDFRLNLPHCAILRSQASPTRAHGSLPCLRSRILRAAVEAERRAPAMARKHHGPRCCRSCDVADVVLAPRWYAGPADRDGLRRRKAARYPELQAVRNALCARPRRWRMVVCRVPGRRAAPSPAASAACPGVGWPFCPSWSPWWRRRRPDCAATAARFQMTYPELAPSARLLKEG